MDNDVVIWGLLEGSRIRIGRSFAKYAPIPFAAMIIARVDECDANIMVRWCWRMAKRGWSIERMIDACEADP